MAENVAGALKLEFLDEDKEGVQSTADMDAYTMYLSAMQLLHNGIDPISRPSEGRETGVKLFKWPHRK